MEPTFHDAQRAAQQNSIDTILKRSREEEKDAFTWRDPLRDFESMGQFVPPELRHWTQANVETRLAYLEVHRDKYLNRRGPQEEKTVFERRMKTAWRDIAYIVGEELKCFVRPQLAGRGSADVIATAMTLIVRPPEVAVEKKKK